VSGGFKTYDPKQVEDRLYAEWMEKGYFHAEIDKEKTPNITGQLHMGHALDETLQDIYKMEEDAGVLHSLAARY